MCVVVVGLLFMISHAVCCVLYVVVCCWLLVCVFLYVCLSLRRFCSFCVSCVVCCLLCCVLCVVLLCC